MTLLTFLPEFLFIATVFEGVLSFAFLYGGLVLLLQFDDLELAALKIRYQELSEKNSNHFLLFCKWQFTFQWEYSRLSRMIRNWGERSNARLCFLLGMGFLIVTLLSGHYAKSPFSHEPSFQL
jgi:hypothetical protein